MSPEEGARQSQTTHTLWQRACHAELQPAAQDANELGIGLNSTVGWFHCVFPESGSRREVGMQSLGDGHIRLVKVS